MGIIVAKFGGSSVADAAQIRKTRAIVEADATRRFVVVSGPGKRSKEDEKITDLLYRFKDLAAAGQIYEAEKIFSIIEARFLGLETELGVAVDMGGLLTEIRERLTAGASRDYAASRGEYLNARLIAAFYGYDFVDAEGVVLFDRSGNFLADETDAALSNELARHSRAVIPGFYGTLPDGEIKTFSRGGSDITGAIVARAAKADLYENWTDVSGFLMTDPRIVENPMPIPLLTYREQRELSAMGASVLHEDAITPARIGGIPIQIRNTNAPEDAGTRIVRDDDPEALAAGLKGITGKKGFMILRLYKNAAGPKLPLLARLLVLTARAGLSVESAPGGIDTLALVLSGTPDQAALEAFAKSVIDELAPDHLEIRKEVTLLAAVGNGIPADGRIAADITRALEKASIRPLLLEAGANDTCVLTGVDDEEYETALRAVYDALTQPPAFASPF
ncbi:MAG: aspartate kinase [Clostridiales bacterium]|nr:aspartate kinase [Clostridiales bacterium]